VAVVDRDGDGAASVAAEIGEAAVPYAIDVTDEPALVAAIDDAADRFGGLDVGVCSAISMAQGRLLELGTDDWRHLVEVGLTATVVTGRELARHMVDQGRSSSIVSLSSNAGLAPYPGAGAYSSTKAAVIMLSKQQGIERTSTVRASASPAKAPSEALSAVPSARSVAPSATVAVSKSRRQQKSPSATVKAYPHSRSKPRPTPMRTFVQRRRII
jgi:NAD(P)-dependent dehydrogenase (short-subunit alcohol dehydrogenase family)